MATLGLDIRPLQFVEIRGDTSMQECIDTVSLAVERVGAVPCLNVTSIAHEAERIRTLSGDWLRRPSPFLLDLARTVDAVIVIERDWNSLVALCPAEKLEAWNQGVGLLVEQQESRRIPYCLIANPKAIPQEQLLVSRNEAYEAIEAAISEDVDNLRALLRSAQEIIDNGRVLEIRTRNHGCMRCDLGRPVHQSDGRQNASLVLNIPYGSLSFTVPEDSVQGTICFDRWRHVRDLFVTFDSGRISDISAANNPEAFADFVGTHSGDRDRISHIGIGVNPGIKRPTGLATIDECKAGTVFVAFGENRYMGGKNESTLNIDLVCSGSTVLCDTKYLVRDGRLALNCPITP
jgi:aminopeptidase